MPHRAVRIPRSERPHHHASFQVFPEPDGNTRLAWITDVLPHTVAEEARLRIYRGLQVMRETIEAAASR